MRIALAQGWYLDVDSGEAKGGLPGKAPSLTLWKMKFDPKTGEPTMRCTERLTPHDTTFSAKLVELFAATELERIS